MFLHRWWKNFKNFFPITLVKTESLKPDGKYIFGYHPHGIISYGAFSTFATEGCDFSINFPGIRVHLVRFFEFRPQLKASEADDRLRST